MDIVEEETFDLVIRRSHVLNDAFRKIDKVSFDPRKRLNVTYASHDYCTVFVLH